jgi:predicted nucleotidyltransferase
MHVDPELRASVTAALRRAGASFAFIHGSRAAGRARPGSDLDVAAWWGAEPPASWESDLPDGVDLLVLDRAPLELAGRVALHGILLFEDDPAVRVRWQADTRRIYFDEEERQRRLDALYLRRRHG